MTLSGFDDAASRLISQFLPFRATRGKYEGAPCSLFPVRSNRPHSMTNPSSPFRQFPTWFPFALPGFEVSLLSDSGQFPQGVWFFPRDFPAELSPLTTVLLVTSGQLPELSALKRLPDFSSPLRRQRGSSFLSSYFPQPVPIRPPKLLAPVPTFFF